MTEQESRERIVAQQLHLARECLEDADAAAARGSSRLVWEPCVLRLLSCGNGGVRRP